MVLLDTNICIYAMKNRYPALSNRLLTIHPDQLAVSSITVGELEYGAAKSKWGEQTRLRLELFLSAFQIIPFDRKDAVVFGRLRAELAAQGSPIGPYDLMIAAQGLCRGYPVVTHNTREFNRVPGLLVEDWTQENELHTLLQEGLDDMQADRSRPAEEAMADPRNRLDL